MSNISINALDVFKEKIKIYEEDINEIKKSINAIKARNALTNSKMVIYKILNFSVYFIYLISFISIVAGLSADGSNDWTVFWGIVIGVILAGTGFLAREKVKALLKGLPETEQYNDLQTQIDQLLKNIENVKNEKRKLLFEAEKTLQKE